MTLQDAKQQLAEIICADEAEKATVINILHLNGETCEFNHGGLIISLYDHLHDKSIYDIREYPLHCYPNIPASDFIAANTPKDITEP